MKVSENTSIYLTSKDSNCRLEKINERDLAIESNPKFQSIKLDKDNLKQRILGFGGAFTEASASIYAQLSKSKKSEIIESYFGKNGNQYNMGRTHINSCDFSLSNYALCETEDRNLTNFSIQRG